MKHTKLAIGAALAGAVVLGALAVSYGGAQTNSSRTDGDFNKSQEEAIQLIVRDYLIDHPEVLIESLNEYASKQRADAENQAKENARKNLSALLDEKHGFVAGKNPAAAKVAIIELFDYHCGFCKRASGFVQDLTRNDAAVKVVFREFPILRDESDYAAAAALASRSQGKYVDLHFALMNASGLLTQARVEDIAKKTGVNVEAMNAGVDAPVIEESILETRRIASEMDVDGTPTFVIASLNGAYVEVIQGFRSDDVKRAIAEAKKAAP